MIINLHHIVEPGAAEWPGGVPDEQECQKCANVHAVLNALLKIIPM